LWTALAASPALAQVAPPHPTPAAVAAAPAETAAPAATAAGPASATPPADPTLGISFDVVSIKHTEQGFSRVTDPGDGDGITITNSTLFEIIRWNFNVSMLRGDQIQGAPEWFTSVDENYEIRAKVAAADVAAWQKLSDGARRLVFRKVLVDRFKFAWHFADVEQPVYFLVVAKGGPKFKEAKADELSPYAADFHGPDGLPYKGTGFHWLSPTRCAMQQAHMSSFAKGFLSNYSGGRPVIDKTGLTGAYNFTLEFAPEYLNAGTGNPDNDASEPVAPSIFTALQEQLGLKLESGKGPVSHLIIDHIERPSEN